jgi:hypothetical protein
MNRLVHLMSSLVLAGSASNKAENVDEQETPKTMADQFRRPRHLDDTDSLDVHRSHFFESVGAVELPPNTDQSTVTWDIPDESTALCSESCLPTHVCLESSCECLSRWCCCIPCCSFRPFSISFVSFFSVNAGLRDLCKLVRLTILQSLRELVSIDYFIYREYQGKTDLLSMDYIDALYSRVLQPIEVLQIKLDENVSLGSRNVSPRALEVVQLETLKKTAINMDDFLKSVDPTFEQWMYVGHMTKISLRFIADRLTSTLNETPLWKCLVDRGCFARRQAITVKRGT